MINVDSRGLGRQFLTGKSTDCTQVEDKNYRATIARPRFEPENFKENSELLIPFGEITEQHSITKAQLSLAWLLAKGEDMIPIPSTSNLTPLKENAEAGDIVLSAETVAELDDLISDEKIAGARYKDLLMITVDSEKDR